MELLLLSLFFVFIIQQSSLYKSLILVPFSFLLMMVLNSWLVLSGLFFFIFVMVFIGGLLVLLVSVSSLSAQEQGVSGSSASMMIIAGFLLSLFWTRELYTMESSNVSMVTWVLEVKGSILVVTLLVVGLLVISLMVFEFKGLVRNICLLSV